MRATQTVSMLAPVLALVASLCDAGEVVCFTPGDGRTCSQSTLKNVEFKSVVTEFIDPQQTTIGHAISRLLWREVLESIYDIRGAGVILAYDEQDQLRAMLKGQDYQTVLQHDYHNAALRVARELGAQMTLWGVVLEHEGSVQVEPYLTLLPRAQEHWTQLQLRFERPGVLPLSAQIANERLRFAPLQTDRAQLFRHDWLTRCRLAAGCPQGIEVREGPANGAAVIAHVPEGSTVPGRDMRDQWVEIERPGGVGYVNVYYLEILSPAVHVLGKAVRLRVEPGAGTSLTAVSAAAGLTLPTVGARRLSNGQLWHAVEVNGVRGWLPPETVQRDYVFPMVHFVSGIYRYARGDYAGATREFQRFTERAGAENNVTLSTAYQYLAASKVAAAGIDSMRSARDAISDIQKAAEQTPYDANVFVMRSLVRLGTFQDSHQSIEDLRHALSLDARNSPATEMIGKLDAMRVANRLEAIVPGQDPNRFATDVAALHNAAQSR